jgi:manganese efflux pump family protein
MSLNFPEKRTGMNIYSIVLIGVGLSMDAFAAALVKGLCSKDLRYGLALKVGLYFGVFQGFMVWLGYTLGLSFSGLINAFDHWVAFVLLALIGGKMIYEGFQPKDLSCEVDPGTSVKAMITISIATSIDALAVGISLALLSTDIVSTSLIISFVTFALSFLGVRIGKRWAAKLDNTAEIMGGLVLIGIGIKILIDHLT